MSNKCRLVPLKLVVSELISQPNLFVVRVTPIATNGKKISKEVGRCYLLLRLAVVALLIKA